MTDTIKLKWEGKYFVSSTNTSTSSTYHITGTNMTVDWGDGTTGTITKNNRFTHTYSKSGIYTITITGDSITKLGNRTFYGCNGLKSITIPSSISSIGTYCFYVCQNLQYIVFTGKNPPTVSNTNAWPNNSLNGYIFYVPKGNFSAYRNASNYGTPFPYEYYVYPISQPSNKKQQVICSLYEKIYPVGSIYMSTEENPFEVFNNVGVWIPIKDSFLLSCGDTYGNCLTGGEKTVQLNTTHLPSHSHLSHEWDMIVSANGNTGKYSLPSGTFAIASVNDRESSTRITNTAGNDESHTNMPPYYTIKMWERIL